MGDADNEVQGIAQDFEVWMNETADAVEEGLNHIMTLTAELKRRTNIVWSEYKTLTSLKRFFLSFNLVVLPVVLSLLICYMAQETVEGNESVSQDVQPIVSFLMFLSGVIGVPFYLYAIFEYVRIVSENKDKIIRFLKFHHRPASSIDDVSFSTIPISEERLDELVRVLRHRIPQAFRSGLEISSRISDQTVDSTLTDARYELKRFSSEMMRELDSLAMMKADKCGNKENIDPKEKQDSSSILYELQLRRYDTSPDLSIRIEPKGMLSQESPEDTVEPVGTTDGFCPGPMISEKPITESFESPSRIENSY